MMPFDYTDAPPPQFELIPQGTIATVAAHIRPGGAGEDGGRRRETEGARAGGDDDGDDSPPEQL